MMLPVVRSFRLLCAIVGGGGGASSFFILKVLAFLRVHCSGYRKSRSSRQNFVAIHLAKRFEN